MKIIRIHMLCIVFFLCLHSPVLAEMAWPIQLPRHVTGTFGEYRSGHFHHGLDMSCNKSKGIAIIATQKGYISSVMYQKWGIGYAVFITHKDGTRTLYGHLDGFSEIILNNKKVKQYAKQIQNRKDFRVDFVKPVIPVKKKEVIGYSGDSGRGHEHLHFEIRDRDNNPINPLKFGLTVKDTSSPVIRTLYLVPLDSKSFIDGKSETYTMPIKMNKKKTQHCLTGKTPDICGKIGILMDAYDHAGYRNKVAPYGYRLKLNNRQVLSLRFDKIKRKLSRRIGLYYDYDNSTLSCYTFFLYSRINHTGIIDTNNYKKQLKVSIDCFDAQNNCTNVSFSLRVKKYMAYAPEKPNLVPGKSLSLYNRHSLAVEFSPECALYSEHVHILCNRHLDISKKGLVQKSRLYIVSPTNICLDKPVCITMKYNGRDHGKVGIYSVTKKGHTRFRGNKYNRHHRSYSIKSYRLGRFVLLKDTTAPGITFRGIPKHKKTVASDKTVKLYIKDTGSGIDLKSVYLRVDNKKVIWDYDPDNRCIEILPHNRIWQKGKHTIRIRVQDKAGNTSKIVFHYNY